MSGKLFAHDYRLFSNQRRKLCSTTAQSNKNVELCLILKRIEKLQLSGFDTMVLMHLQSLVCV
jgi:hypothetical protein